MIDIDKFPKTFEKSKTAFEEKWRIELNDVEKVHWMCIRDIDSIEYKERILYSTKCVDMMYKMFCRVFTEAERSWFFAIFAIRERNIDESRKTYMQMVANNTSTSEEYLEGLRIWDAVERKKILDEEIPFTQSNGIDYEKFQKNVTWFMILLDKLTDLDEETFKPDPWFEDWDDGITAFHEFDPDDFIK